VKEVEMAAGGVEEGNWRAVGGMQDNDPEQCPPAAEDRAIVDALAGSAGGVDERKQL